MVVGKNEGFVFEIESIVRGGGLQEHRITLKGDVLYGNANINGGRSSYHQIYPESFLLATRGASAGGNWVRRPVTDERKKRKATEALVGRIPTKKRYNKIYKQKKLWFLA